MKKEFYRTETFGFKGSARSLEKRKEIVQKYKENRLSLDGAVLVGRHPRIGDYSKISDSNIDNFCILGEHVNVERSAIMDAAKIGDYAHVSDSILGRKVVVESTRENPVRIESTSVIGNAVHIRKGCKLIRTKVNYGLMIPPDMTYIDKFLQNYEDVAKLAS